MPKVYVALVKNKTEKGHGGAGLAVLVPLDASAAADPHCDAASFYKGTDGKVLFERKMDRRMMENKLRQAERLVFEGNNHRDVQDGKVANAFQEAKRILEEVGKSFRVSAQGKVLDAPSASMSWSCVDARLAAESNHEKIASEALMSYGTSKGAKADELLRIACVTKHAEVSAEAVKLAVEEKADVEALMTAVDSLPHEKAAMVAYEAVKKLSGEAQA